MVKTFKLAVLAILASTTTLAADPETNVEVADLGLAPATEARPLATRVAALTVTPIAEDEPGVIVEEILSVYVIGKGITLTN